MRPTIHSQEYPIKFNLKLPFQLRKKEEEQRRLKCVNIDGYKKRNWGQCIFNNIVQQQFLKMLLYPMPVLARKAKLWIVNEVYLKIKICTYTFYERIWLQIL